MLNISLHKRKWFRCWNVSYGVSNINPIYVKKQENEIQKLEVGAEKIQIVLVVMTVMTVVVFKE